MKQRAEDDCTVCAIAMATGETYERVMSVASEARGGYRYQGRQGTMSPRGVLIDLGYEAEAVQCHDVPLRALQKLLWGRRAVLSVPSLNGFGGHHDVYWDGRALHDPGTKLTYGDGFPTVQPIWAVMLNERSPAALSSGEPTPAVAAAKQGASVLSAPDEPNTTLVDREVEIGSRALFAYGQGEHPTEGATWDNTYPDVQDEIRKIVRVVLSAIRPEKEELAS